MFRHDHLHTSSLCKWRWKTWYTRLGSYFTYLELISSLLVRSSSHIIILELITSLKILSYFLHIIGYQLFYMVLVSILQLSLIQVSIFIFFPTRIFLQTSAFSLEQYQHQHIRIFGIYFHVLSWGRIFPLRFCLFPHFFGQDKLWKGDHRFVVGTYMHIYFWLVQGYHHKVRLKEGCWIIINPLIK